MELKEALVELRKNEKKKFDQTIDLIINLKGVDMKRDNVSAVVSLPNKLKDKNICAFLPKRSDVVNTITPADFPIYKDKKQLKMLVKKYDFFIAVAPLLPQVAANFGKVLGPVGKMPTPQLGLIMQDTDAGINSTIDKVSKSIRIKMKEASIKVAVGKENMNDAQIMENIKVVYDAVVAALPTKKENVRAVLVKLTMSKPVKVEMK